MLYLPLLGLALAATLFLGGCAEQPSTTYSTARAASTPFPFVGEKARYPRAGTQYYGNPRSFGGGR